MNKNKTNNDASEQDLAVKAFDKNKDLDKIISEAKENDDDVQIVEGSNVLREEIKILIKKVFSDEKYCAYDFNKFIMRRVPLTTLRYIPSHVELYEGGRWGFKRFKSAIHFSEFLKDGEYFDSSIHVFTPEAMNDAKLFAKAYKKLSGKEMKILKEYKTSAELEKVVEDVQEKNAQQEAEQESFVTMEKKPKKRHNPYITEVEVITQEEYERRHKKLTEEEKAKSRAKFDLRHYETRKKLAEIIREVYGEENTRVDEWKNTLCRLIQYEQSYLIPHLKLKEVETHTGRFFHKEKVVRTLMHAYATDDASIVNDIIWGDARDIVIEVFEESLFTKAQEFASKYEQAFGKKTKIVLVQYEQNKQ